MIHHGDCLDVMAAMEPESVDAVVTDPPYGLEFMGKEWDKIRKPTTHPLESSKVMADNGRPRSKADPWATERTGYGAPQKMKRCRKCGGYPFSGSKVCRCEKPDWDARTREYGLVMQQWHERWAEAAYRVAKPSAYLLAFGGTRTVHRMTVAIEDAGWIIRDMLVWAYASGFPKSKASLKPAWEPIVMARKPGPLRELAIDACRIGTDGGTRAVNFVKKPDGRLERWDEQYAGARNEIEAIEGGRWPANVILTDPIFDGGWDGVVGGGESAVKGEYRDVETAAERPAPWFGSVSGATHDYRNSNTYANDSGTYSRFFLVPKADRNDREPVITPDGHDRATRFSTHPTVKPTELMRHLVRLVTPTGGTVLDPFAGSGSTLLAAEQEGFEWIGVEKEAEYVAIAEARLNGTQRGLGLPA